MLGISTGDCEDTIFRGPVSHPSTVFISSEADTTGEFNFIEKES